MALYPFGWAMPGRRVEEEEYRYGFNGMEKEEDVAGYTTMFRQYDPRLGRWLSVDPKGSIQPYLSPYIGMNNNPIFLTDPNGDIAPAIWALIVAAIEAGGQTAVDAVLGATIFVLTGEPYGIGSLATDFFTNLVPGWGELRTYKKFRKIVKAVDVFADVIKSSKAVKGLGKQVDKIHKQFDKLYDQLQTGNIELIRNELSSLTGKII